MHPFGEQECTSRGYSKCCIWLIADILYFISTLSSRIAIEDVKIRGYLLNFVDKAKGKITAKEKRELIGIGLKEVRELMKWVIDEYKPHVKSVLGIPASIRALIRCLATTSPVCSYIHPSDEIAELVRSLTETNIRTSAQDMLHLQWEVPILFEVVKQLGETHAVLPGCFRDLITYLINRSQAPFNPEHKVPDIPGQPARATSLSW